MYPHPHPTPSPPSLLVTHSSIIRRMPRPSTLARGHLPVPFSSLCSLQQLKGTVRLSTGITLKKADRKGRPPCWSSGQGVRLDSERYFPRHGWFVGCLTSQQQASVPQGRICLDNFTCCHTEIEVADQTSYLTQSQYIATEPTSPSADPITPGAWQGSHWSANFEATGMTLPRKSPVAIRTPDLLLTRRTP